MHSVAHKLGEEPRFILKGLGGMLDRLAIFDGYVELALTGKSEAAMRAIELWASVYGAEAGNLALKVMGTGGVFLGGGVAAKILPKLQGAGFMKAFADKGRFRSFMQAIPVRVILNDKAALLGAARYAVREAP